MGCLPPVKVGVVLAGHRRKGEARLIGTVLGLETPGCMFNLVSI